MPVDKLTAFGAAPRDIDPVECDMSPRSELAELYKMHKKEVHQALKKQKSTPPARREKLPKKLPKCIEYILSELPKTDKTTFNKLTMILVNYFQQTGFDEDETLGRCSSFIADYPHSTSYTTPADRMKHFESQIKYLEDKSNYQFDCSYILGLGFPGSAFECRGCGLNAQGIDREYRGEAKRINDVATKKGTPTSNVVPIKQPVMETNNPAAVSEKTADKPINYRRASVSLRKIMEYEFPEQPDVISRGILPEGGGLIIVGESGVGKSIITLEWAVSLVMEWEILGLEVPKARKVYIFQSENTLAQVKYRLKQIFEGLGVSNPPDHLFFSRPRATYDLTNDDHINDMIAELKERAIDTFFIDPLSSFHQVPENDNSRMRTVLDKITYISRVTGAAAVVVHHFGKPGENDKDVEYRYRGASSIKDWADTMISVTRKPHEDRILRNVYFNKIRNGPEQKPLLLERSKGCPRDENGELIENFIHTIVDEESLCPPEKVTEILEDLGGSIDGQKEFIALINKEADCKDRAAAKYIRKAVEKGTIKESSLGPGRKKKYYVEAPL